MRIVFSFRFNFELLFDYEFDGMFYVKFVLMKI